MKESTTERTTLSDLRNAALPRCEHPPIQQALYEHALKSLLSAVNLLPNTHPEPLSTYLFLFFRIRVEQETWYAGHLSKYGADHAWPTGEPITLGAFVGNSALELIEQFVRPVFENMGDLPGDLDDREVEPNPDPVFDELRDAWLEGLPTLAAELPPPDQWPAAQVNRDVSLVVNRLERELNEILSDVGNELATPLAGYEQTGISHEDAESASHVCRIVQACVTKCRTRPRPGSESGDAETYRQNIAGRIARTFPDWAEALRLDRISGLIQLAIRAGMNPHVANRLRGHTNRARGMLIGDFKPTEHRHLWERFGNQAAAERVMEDVAAMAHAIKAAASTAQPQTSGGTEAQSEDGEHAPDPAPPLSDTERQVLDVIRTQPEGEGITGPQIIDELNKHGFPIEQSTLTRHTIPKLKTHHGVQNRPKVGYFISKAR